MNLSAWVDSVFAPLYGYLETVYGWLIQVSQVSSGGLDLDRFLGPISWLGDGFIFFVTSVVSATFVIAVVASVAAGWRLYLDFKDGVKWW